jgi:hypothetical protein
MTFSSEIPTLKDQRRLKINPLPLLSPFTRGEFSGPDDQPWFCFSVPGTIPFNCKPSKVSRRSVSRLEIPIIRSDPSSVFTPVEILMSLIDVPMVNDDARKVIID